MLENNGYVTSWVVTINPNIKELTNKFSIIISFINYLLIKWEDNLGVLCVFAILVEKGL